MSKRQEIRERRRREQIRNRIITIAAVVLAALFVTFVLIVPSLKNASASSSATQTAQNASPVPVVVITPPVWNTRVDGVHLGDPNAPVKVDVFSDFRCSACLYYYQNIEHGFIKDYVETGKVYYTFRTFLTIDGYDGTNASEHSANAAMCAGEQNRFWEYHDTLFANQLSESALLFTDERLVRMAENLQLDMTAFNACFNARTYSDTILKDITDARSLKVTGTPSIIVNGTLLSNFQLITQAVDDALGGK
jgi:protein-disulfide isomerase